MILTIFIAGLSVLEPVRVCQFEKQKTGIPIPSRQEYEQFVAIATNSLFDRKSLSLKLSQFFSEGFPVNRPAHNGRKTSLNVGPHDTTDPPRQELSIPTI